MKTFAKLSVATILAIGAFHQMAIAASPEQGPTGFNPMLWRVPLTKGYRIAADYSPTQVAYLVQQFVPADSSGGKYGQFGIRPVYTAGANVMVRANPETHARIAQYLSDLGVGVRKSTE